MDQCVKVLSNGYVQSYIDLFYLLHGENESIKNYEKSNRNANAAGSLKNTKVKVDLDLVTKTMMEAEKAIQDAAYGQLQESYHALAKYFASIKLPITAIFFLEKALEYAKVTDDPNAIKASNYEIGLVYQDVPKETRKSIEYHEAHLKMAEEQNDQEGVKAAHTQLSIVYERRATELEEEGTEASYLEAVRFHEQCIALAKLEENHEAMAHSNFRLGNVYVMLEKPQEADQYLESYLSFNANTSDIKSKGGVLVKLAKAKLQAGDRAAAIEYLNEALSIATDVNDTEMKRVVCGMLGAVYAQLGDHKHSEEYLRMNFDIIYQNVKSYDIEDDLLSRVALGYSLAQSRKCSLAKMIESDIPSLVTWKVDNVFQQS